MLGKEARNKMSYYSNKLGIFFGKFARPNFYTFLTLLSGVAAAYAIYAGEFFGGICLILVSGFFDLLDGAVARAINGITKWGAMADSITDKATEIAIYFALALYSNVLFFGAMLAVSAFMVSSYISKHAASQGAKSGGGLLERKERILLLIVGLLAMYFNIEYMAYILYILGVMSILTGIQRLWRTKKIFETGG